MQVFLFRRWRSSGGGLRASWRRRRIGSGAMTLLARHARWRKIQGRRGCRCLPISGCCALLRSQVAAKMNAEAFTLDFKLRQVMLGKEREEIAQLIHRKLLFRTARLALLVTPPPAVTVALPAAAFALRLSGSLLRSFFAFGLCCAFLVAHSSFTPGGTIKTFVPVPNRVEQSEEPQPSRGVSADGQLRLAASEGARFFFTLHALVLRLAFLLLRVFLTGR
jgi:hypothetical protein